MFSQRSVARTHPLDLVIIMLGGNDLKAAFERRTGFVRRMECLETDRSTAQTTWVEASILELPFPLISPQMLQGNPRG